MKNFHLNDTFVRVEELLAFRKVFLVLSNS